MFVLNPWLSPEGYQFCLEGVSPFRFRDQLATNLKFETFSKASGKKSFMCENKNTLTPKRYRY